MTIPPHPRILFTADLHLECGTAVEGFREALRREKPDAVVIAGDLSVPGRAEEHLALLRERVGKLPMAVCLGNHDLWVGGTAPARYAQLQRIVTDYWEIPCRENGIILLDRQNASFGKVTIVGGYGHFDLGLAWPGLEIQGRRVTKSDYLGGADWNDFRRIPRCAEFLEINARREALAIGSRLDQAMRTGRRILMATHTLPWAELNAHPRTGNWDDYYAAYSGNSLMGAEIAKRAGTIEFLMCGHTHKATSETTLHGIRCLNTGGGYHEFRGILYDTSDRSIRWVE
jgi:predicted phosphodiesterase